MSLEQEPNVSESEFDSNKWNSKHKWIRFKTGFMILTKKEHSIV